MTSFNIDNLSNDEQKELEKAEAVYYYSKDKSTRNKDNRLILNEGDHIFFRYKVNKHLGKGAFSNVYECFDYKHKKNVALKVIRNEKRFHKQAEKVEIPALLKINKESTEYLLNIFKIFDYKDHICYSYELLEHDLYKEMEIREFRGFSVDKVIRYAGDILRGLDVLLKLKIIHCDLKPENIMLTKDGSLKIIDLGSCYISKTKKLNSTYVQSRYYRAPEVVMGCDYSHGIDIWSFGCIIYELLTGTPLFRCKSSSDLIGEIVCFLGIPPIEMIENSLSGLSYFKNVNSYQLVNQYNKYGGLYQPKSRSLNELLKEENEPIQKIIDLVISWNYNNRPTPNYIINFFKL